MTSGGELNLLKDRQSDTGQKEILLAHLHHLVISSLAVVFIDLGVAVPRDLQKQVETKKKITPDIVENRLVELKKVFVKQKKDVDLTIVRTPQDPDSFTVLRVRDQQWRTGYEVRLKKLHINFREKQCLYLGEALSNFR